MAVYTSISFKELEGFLAGYGIGEPVSFNPIAEGIENSNFALRTTKGAYILTLFEKRVTAADLPFFLSLMEHLAARGTNCPVPVPLRNGARATTLHNRPAAILTFLGGASLPQPAPAHCMAAGEALARLHIAGADFALTRKNTLGLEGWRTLAEQTRASADDVQPGLGALIDASLARFANEWPSGLASGIIHADLFPDNVLFTGNAVSGLIDFYFACNDAYAYDLAVMLNAWCFEEDGRFNTEKSRALIAGYRRHRDLDAAEIDALPQLAAGAALRFTLTRLYDWLHPDETAIVRPKDPRDFAERLRFHLAVQSPQDYQS
jgi:homoserine kinase type II